MRKWEDDAGMKVRNSLDVLMNPSSMAVVGASTRSEATGSAVIRNLDAIGYTGDIYPVNPRYEEIQGRRCYPSLSAIPGDFDSVFIGVPAGAGPALLAEAAAKGARAGYVNASGYADGDEAGKQLQRELQEVARANGMAVCGPNNTGLVNLHDRAAPWTAGPIGASPGRVAIITQSGSASLVLSEDPRRLGLAYVITAGNEAVTTAADYLEHVINDDRVEIVLMFLETIRNPERFALAADKARRLGKRIIVLKIGRSDVGKVAVMAHTGSLAGNDSTYDAYFRAHGIIRVSDFDEMIETAVLFSAYARPPVTPHVVPMTLSGGEAALVADLSAEVGVSLPPFRPATRDRIAAALPPFSQSARNPLDAFGLGWDFERFSQMIDALLDDPDVGVIVPAIDAPSSGGGDAEWAREMAILFEKLAPDTDKKFVIFNNSGDLGLDSELDEILRRARIPCLTGMRESLVALNRWTHFDDRVIAPIDSVLTESAERAAAVMRDAQASDEDVFAALGLAGVPMVATASVSTVDGAVRVSGRLGYPVVMKGITADVGHKAKAGLVRMGVGSAAAVRQSMHALRTRLDELGAPPDARSITIQAQGPRGFEVLIGTRADALGLVVVVGAGGVDAEQRRDVAVRIGPVSEEDVLAMLSETNIGKALGALDAGNVARALARSTVALADVAAAASPDVVALEVNPLIVSDDGQLLGVDVLREFGNAR
jgi:acyl-CoA synthetase (NDP forming)